MYKTLFFLFLLFANITTWAKSYYCTMNNVVVSTTASLQIFKDNTFIYQESGIAPGPPITVSWQNDASGKVYWLANKRLKLKGKGNAIILAPSFSNSDFELEKIFIVKNGMLIQEVQSHETPLVCN